MRRRARGDNRLAYQATSRTSKSTEAGGAPDVLAVLARPEHGLARDEPWQSGVVVSVLTRVHAHHPLLRMQVGG